MSHLETSFKERLDQHYSWPAKYLFKFIVPRGEEGAFNDIFPGITLTIKASSGGKYVSITSNVLMKSTQEVIDIYKQAYLIPGIISL